MWRKCFQSTIDLLSITLMMEDDEMAIKIFQGKNGQWCRLCGLNSISSSRTHFAHLTSAQFKKNHCLLNWGWFFFFYFFFLTIPGMFWILSSNLLVSPCISFQPQSPLQIPFPLSWPFVLWPTEFSFLTCLYSVLTHMSNVHAEARAGPRMAFSIALPFITLKGLSNEPKARCFI